MRACCRCASDDLIVAIKKDVDVAAKLLDEEPYAALARDPIFPSARALEGAGGGASGEAAGGDDLPPP